MPKFNTVLRIDETGIEVPIVIEYERVRAYLSPGRESPDEPAHCEVTDVFFPFLTDVLNRDDEMQSALMADWDADDADHEERRADAARKGE